jgi:beta-galactosidase
MMEGDRGGRKRGKMAQRVRESFDCGWRFMRGDINVPESVKSGMLGGLADAVARKGGKHLVVAFVDRGMRHETDPNRWPEVTLPHDWVVEGPFDRKDDPTHGYRPRGLGYYRKVFNLPGEWRDRKVSIEFDGIFRNSTVWVNGHRMLEHRSGYTGFPVDITDVARYGDEGPNCVLVRVDATETEGWWYEGGGIYRHAWLVATNRVHAARWGVFVTTPAVDGRRASVRVETTVMNESAKAVAVEVRTTITDPRGRKVATASSRTGTGANGRAVVVQSLRVMHPRLWSPNTPELYRALTEIRAEGRPVDTTTTAFGIRTIRFDADRGLFVNGIHTPVKGTCNHQDFAGVGVALPDSLHEFKIRMLKEMGCNAYRCAHSPHAPELMDACDRLGMLVMDENRKLSSTKEGLADLEELILRDRNHPCVFIWSLENEEPLEGTVMGARILDSMVRLAHRLDPTRPVTGAQNHGHLENGYSDKMDVKGFNYGHNRDKDVNYHRARPGKPVTATESNATTATRGIYDDLPARGYANAYGTNVWQPPYTWNTGYFIPWQAYLKHPFLTGIFVWTGFDYRGEPTPYKWPAAITNYGSMDLCGFPKDGYWHHKAMWSAEPVLHLMPHWNRPATEAAARPGRLASRHGEGALVSRCVNERGEVKVWALTNMDRVDLSLNGRDMGTRLIPRGGYGEWFVKWEPGVLRAVGWKGGKKAAVATVETTGPAAALELEPDRDAIRADGRDAVPVRISVVDRRGRVVPDACPLVKLAVSGPGRLIGVGNGDPSCHDPEKGDTVRAFNGHAMAILQSNGMPGILKLIARSKSLGTGRTGIEAG